MSPRPDVKQVKVAPWLAEPWEEPTVTTWRPVTLERARQSRIEAPTLSAGNRTLALPSGMKTPVLPRQCIKTPMLWREAPAHELAPETQRVPTGQEISHEDLPTSIVNQSPASLAPMNVPWPRLQQRAPITNLTNVFVMMGTPTVAPRESKQTLRRESTLDSRMESQAHSAAVQPAPVPTSKRSTASLGLASALFFAGVLLTVSSLAPTALLRVYIAIPVVVFCGGILVYYACKTGQPRSLPSRRFGAWTP